MSDTNLWGEQQELPETTRKKTLRKIEIMHAKFGTTPNHVCGECHYFLLKQWDKVYRKCSQFGNTNGPGTDWLVSYVACGKFIPEDGG